MQKKRKERGLIVINGDVTRHFCRRPECNQKIWLPTPE